MRFARCFYYFIKHLNLFLFLFILPIFSQEAFKKKAYKEITLLDFEGDTLPDIELISSALVSPRIHHHNEFPAPLKKSKKYLGLELGHYGNETVRLSLKKPISLTQYCSEIRIWVYGTFNSGRLYIKIIDTHGNTGILYAGVLRYRGWKKLTIPVPRKYKQQDLYFNSKSPFQIKEFIYNLGDINRLKKNQYIFFDDITALVRPRYLLNVVGR